MKLHLGTRIVCGITIVECNGRIVLGDESSELRQMVRDLLKDHHQLVLDLGNVAYIDSSGLGVLVALWSSAKKCGGEIKLANLSPEMNDMLQAHQTSNRLPNLRQSRRCRRHLQSRRRPQHGRRMGSLTSSALLRWHFTACGKSRELPRDKMAPQISHGEIPSSQAFGAISGFLAHKTGSE